MEIISEEKLADLLRKHKLWLANAPDGERADLYGADLYGAKDVKCPIACPEKGSFTAFKKARGYIVELYIPEDARRYSATSRKCRCDKAKVGKYVTEPNFNENRWDECSEGIHFFITRQEAVDY